jgi:hypothetical protein
MRAAGVLLLVLISGCAYTRVDYSNSAVTRSGALQVQGGRPLAAVILGGLLIANAVDGEPRTSRLADMEIRPAPEMKADRAINEQDCTKPIEFSGNLRCR